MFGLLITGFLMLLVNVPMKAINDALNGFLTSMSGSNAALLGALLAGMMAADLGGPINKAAYVFGTATLATTVATGGSVVMASVMAGGMVPPLAIFVATRLFKNKFSKTDQDAGLTNIVMGLSFVTEGSIPFAAADPIRAIPSFIIGSALTGGLVGAFGIKLLAPHGGIFVVFLLSHPIMYLVFIAIGAVVSGVIYGFGGLVGAFGIKLLAPHGGIFVVFLLSHPIMYLVFIAIGAVVSGVIYGLLRKAPAVAEA